MADRRCILVDGNSLLYRAFYAIPYLSTRDGQPTNALMGFANMLLKLINDKPDALVVAFDAPAKTFRHDEYESYKATRKPTPDELIAQSGLARELAKCLGLVVLETPGYEADDIVGTCAKQAEANGYDVLIVSGDLDELQLITQRVKVATTTKGVSETTIYDSAAVMDRYGVTPEQFVDFKALKGDASDNIPGVPGVGEKTAAKLVAEYGGVDGILARLTEIPPGRVRDSLEASREQMILSRRLAAIVTDVPLDIDFADLAPHSRPPGEAETLFRRLEFESLLKRLPPSGQPALGIEALTAQNTLPLPETLLISSENDFKELLRCLDEAESVSFWLKASSNGTVEAIGFAWDARAACLAVRQCHQAQTDLVSQLEESFAIPLARLRGWLENESCHKATYDIKGTYLTLAREGVDLKGCTEDVMLAGFLLQPGRGSYSFNWLAGQHLGIEIPQDMSIPKQTALNAEAVGRLSEHLGSKIDSESLTDVYRRIEIPLAPVLARMERVGLQLDVHYIESLAARLGTEITRLEAEICKDAGEDFNVGSTKQLGEVLFGKLNLPSGKRNKTGFSTDAETLEALAPSYEIAAKVLQWREVTKLKSTYADALPRLADPKTHRLHTTLNQTGAATGRLSSSDPNLQNIPIKSELGRGIRAAIIAPPGRTLVSADYSQIELRLLAHMSGDKELKRCFNENYDIHSRTACALFGVDLDGVTEDMRRRAKTINFSVLYGKSAFGLSKELGITSGEATEYIDAYFRQYPSVKDFIQATVEAAKDTGYVSTMYGRKRWFPELHARDRNVRANAERAAFNAPLQGSAADIIKLAMINLDVLLNDSSTAMVLQVHDELLFETDEEDVGDVAAIVKKEMESVGELSVPVTVEVKSGPNWRDMRKVF